MEQKNDELTSLLKELIDDSIKSAKKEVNNEKDNIILSKEAIDILKGSDKTPPIYIIIQTIVAVMVIILSVGGSWYNSKIKMHDFYNELKYLKISVEKIEKDHINHFSDTHDWEIDYQLLKQKVNDLYNKVNKDNKIELP